MNRPSGIAACLLFLPLTTLAATRTYEVVPFDAVSVAAGVNVEITSGPSRSVVAETRTGGFDDLRIAVQGKVLKIDRPPRGWFQFMRPSYSVHVVTPDLRSVSGSSGADVTVKGASDGDFAVDASSGSDIHVSGLKAGTVKAHASSGSDLEIAGSCTTVEVEASSGSDVDARGLRCETGTVHSSSGSDVSLYASRSITGSASSGSDVRVGGAPPVVKVETSSGADVSTVN
jgi:hypothetical protein